MIRNSLLCRPVEAARHVAASFGVGVVVTVVIAASCRAADGTASPESGGLARRWFAPLADSVIWPGSPALANGAVIVGARGGLAALDTGSGAVLWRAVLFSPPTASVSAGNVVVRGGEACIADWAGVGCVEVASGRVLWSAPSDSAVGVYGVSAADDATLYYGTRQHRVIALSLATGARKWVADVAPGAPFPTRVFGTAVRNDTVFATTVRWLNWNGASVAGDLLALDARTGRVLWSYTPSAPPVSGFQTPPLLAGNLAILSDVYTHVLRAIDLTTHDQVWQSAVDASGYISSEMIPAIAGDTVFAGSTDTQLYALDLHTGQLHWRARAMGGSVGSIGLCVDRVIAVPMGGGEPYTIDRGTHVSRRARLLEPEICCSRLR